jgi:hypothetical protein
MKHHPIFLCPVVLFGSFVSVAQSFTITPTTTLAKETATNSSASSTFPTQINGNTKPGNVSKSAEKILLYSGNTTKVFAHFMGWFGSSSGHMNVGYNSADATQVHKQVSDMKSRAISGAILDWYGQGDLTDIVAGLLRTESEAQGLTFAIMEDVGSVSQSARTSNCDVTQKLINDLNYAYSTYEVSPAYLSVGGRPVVFFFGLEAYFVDWARVRTQVSGNPLFVFRNAGAFTDPNSNGAFAWIQVNSANSFDISRSYLDNYYGVGLQHPDRLDFGTGYVGFNDTLAPWTANRFMQRQCGLTWLSSFAEVGKYYNTTTQLPFAQIATWNDYEEGTEVETGIDNCLKPIAWTSGNTLYWKLEGQGPPETVLYFRVFISTDGINLMRLADVSGTYRSLSLSSWPLSTSTTYKIFVKAMGKPSILNQISNMVGYRRGDAVPIASLHLSSTSGKLPFSLTASTSGSTDTGGSIPSSKIDFGDGVILAGPTASHTYQNFGRFVVRAYVTDNLGATATTSTIVTVKPSIGGVVIQQPVAATNIPNYFRVTAYASGTNSVTVMTLYIDGVGLVTVHQDRIDTFVRLLDGTHVIGVNAWDATGAVQTRSEQVLVGIGPNSPPVAVLGLNTFTPPIGSVVRACTAASTDPENGGVSSVVNFGDGSSSVQGTTTYHTYKTAGSFIITATVRDNRGATSSTSATVTVH